MPGNVCKNCGCNEIDEDPTRGDKVCTNCGTILEDQLIVSEIQFQENAAGRASVVGQFVPVDGNQSYSIGGQFLRNFGRDSQQVTLQNAKRKIQEVSSQLRLDTTLQAEALQYFKIVLRKNLTRGRKTEYVVASCLYIICRRDSLPHMLLDFSDVLQVNMYTLGKTYLLICKTLALKLPNIDPCLYIDRFANKLQFGNKTSEVCTTALRLVQRMKRDWMQIGRRPSGLCGAALLVSSRLHDFNRTVKEVIKVVKVGESTIRKRLYEFEETPSSKLTIEEFHTIDLEQEQDPPCFTEGKRHSAKLTEEVEDKETEITSHLEEVKCLQQEIEKSLVHKPRGIWAAYAKLGGEDISEGASSRNPGISEAGVSLKPSSREVAELSNFIETETMKEVIGAGNTQAEDSSSSPALPPAPEKVAEEETAAPPLQLTKTEVPPVDSGSNLSRLEQQLMDEGRPVLSLAPTTASLGIMEIVEDCVTVDEDNSNAAVDTGGELDLDGIDDDELNKFLLSEAEVKIKTEIWMKENADFLIAQKEREEKRLKEEEEQGSRPEKRKRKYKKREKIIGEASSAREAFTMVIQEKKLSRKINYKVLEDLRVWDNDLPKPSPSSSSSQASSSVLSLITSPSPGPSQAQPILKTQSSLVERAKRPIVFEDSETAAPPPAKKKSVQIREPAEWIEREEAAVIEEVASPMVVVEETGPTPYLEHDVPAEEEEDYDDDDEPVCAHDLFGRKEFEEEHDEHYYDSD